MKRAAQLDFGTSKEVPWHFLLGFEGTALPDELRSLLAEGLAGVAIYRRNWTSIEGLRALTKEIRAAAGRPVLMGMDAEPGGPFALPSPFTQWPTAAELGAVNDATLVERVAAAIGRELRAVGVNLNFAPVLDLHVHAESPVTQERSFGGNPSQVAALGGAFVRGLRDAGVLACAKHFPGHGDALLDPHQELPVFRGTPQRLDTMELVPFDAAIQEGVSMVMTAHILLTEIEPKRPASLSRSLIQHTLRERMGFGGVVLADDLGMGAIRKRYGIGEAAVAALRAGTDIVMLCHDWAEVRPAMERVRAACESGKVIAREMQAGRERIAWLRDALKVMEAEGSGRGLETVGCAGHGRLAKEIRKRM